MTAFLKSIANNKNNNKIQNNNKKNKMSSDAVSVPDQKNWK